ncbi:hypothetical protein GQ53DRAFT_815283 [Thozetella sp. PMI_491]|nr:hypothetical protein GQ53DRAFT_815283 [Thozetella sp. PMI_491]
MDYIFAPRGRSLKAFWLVALTISSLISATNQAIINPDPQTMTSITPTKRSASLGGIPLQSSLRCSNKTEITFNRDSALDAIPHLCNSAITHIAQGQFLSNLAGVPVYQQGKPLTDWSVAVRVKRLPRAVLVPGCSSIIIEPLNRLLPPIVPDVCTNTLKSIINSCPLNSGSNTTEAGGTIFSHCLSWSVFPTRDHHPKATPLV